MMVYYLYSVIAILLALLFITGNRYRSVRSALLSKRKLNETQTEGVPIPVLRNRYHGYALQGNLNASKAFFAQRLPLWAALLCTNCAEDSEVSISMALKAFVLAIEESREEDSDFCIVFSETLSTMVLNKRKKNEELTKGYSLG